MAMQIKLMLVSELSEAPGMTLNSNPLQVGVKPSFSHVVFDKKHHVVLWDSLTWLVLVLPPPPMKLSAPDLGSKTTWHASLLFFCCNSGCRWVREDSVESLMFIE